ncbi:hypothetical protein ABIE16_005638 [Pseudomonas sp. 2725]|uniref:hypothetical protein n=1 Tax=Pseudomonas sp. 2725 TaxID=3156449 RepID=UPI003D1CE9D8
MLIDYKNKLPYILSTPTRFCPAAKAAPLFNIQRNKEQTALPLPATGEQAGPKACQ